jgi:hypothetical protein
MFVNDLSHHNPYVIFKPLMDLIEYFLCEPEVITPPPLIELTHYINERHNGTNDKDRTCTNR